MATDVRDAISPASSVLRAAGRLGSRQGLEFGPRYLRYLVATRADRAMLLTAERHRELAAAVLAFRGTGVGSLLDEPRELLCSPQMLRLKTPLSSASVEQVERLVAPGDGEVLDRLAFEAQAHLYPPLVVRNLWRSGLMFADGLDDATRDALATEIVQRLVDVAIDAGLQSVAFPLVEDPWLERVLERLGFRGADLCGVAVLDGLRATSDEAAYLATMRASHRKHLAADRRRFGAEDLRVEQLQPARWLDRIAELEALNLRRYGTEASPAAVAEGLRAMVEHLGGLLRLVGCFDSDELVASGVDVVDDRKYCRLTYGADYDRVEGRYTYQALGFLEPLRFALAHHLERIELGPEAYTAKLGRGATLRRRRIWMLATGAAGQRFLEPLMRFVDERNRGYLDGLA